MAKAIRKDDLKKKDAARHFLNERGAGRDRRGAMLTPCKRIGSACLGDPRVSEIVDTTADPEKVTCRECLAILARRKKQIRR